MRVVGKASLASVDVCMGRLSHVSVTVSVFLISCGCSAPNAQLGRARLQQGRRRSTPHAAVPPERLHCSSMRAGQSAHARHSSEADGPGTMRRRGDRRTARAATLARAAMLARAATLARATGAGVRATDARRLDRRGHGVARRREHGLQIVISRQIVISLACGGCEL